MQKTTILISKKLANRLSILKYNYGMRTMEEVITHYLNKGGNENEHTKINELDKEQIRFKIC